MTLQTYDDQKLDQLALRLLDLSAVVRGMANSCRENEIEEVVLHDKKALEWLDKLEDWTRKAAARMQLETVRARANRRAQALPEPETAISAGSTRRKKKN